MTIRNSRSTMHSISSQDTIYISENIYLGMERHEIDQVSERPPDDTFEVVVIRKVPYLTAALFYLLLVFSIGLFIVSIYFLPTEHASDEMTFAYFLFATPKLLQDASFVSLAGLLIVLPIYLKLRLKKNATLTFTSDAIVITGGRINETIPISDISEVYCIDAKLLDGTPKEKLTLHIIRRKSKNVTVRLTHYLQAEDFMARVEDYKNLRLKAYDFDVDTVTDPDDEE
jgi:hypothetical protein